MLCVAVKALGDSSRGPVHPSLVIGSCIVGATLSNDGSRERKFLLKEGMKAKQGHPYEWISYDLAW